MDTVNQHPRDGDDIRVSSPKDDGIGVETEPFLPNVNAAIVKDNGGITKETGTTHQTCPPDGKVVPKSPDKQVDNVSRDAADPGPNERLLGSFSTLVSTVEEKRLRCQAQTSGLHVPALSASLQGPLNNPWVTTKRRYEVSESSSQSDSDSEDSESMGRSCHSEKCWSSVHNCSSERRRRERLNRKLRALRELLPNSNTVDQVAVLDEVIEYLGTLQRQYLVLSTRSPMYMSSPMMSPTAIQQMYPHYLNQFPALNVPRGMNVGAAEVGRHRLQFPISRGPGTTASTGSTMQIPGLESNARSPTFIPSFRQSSMASLSTQAPSTSTINLPDADAQSGSRE